MIKGNFKIKKIKRKNNDTKKLEDIIAKSGAGSHMVFRSNNGKDELFLDEL